MASRINKLIELVNKLPQSPIKRVSTIEEHLEQVYKKKAESINAKDVPEDYYTREISSIRNLMSDKWRQKFPLSESFYNPKFNPSYYAVLKDGLYDQKPSFFKWLRSYIRW